VPYFLHLSANGLGLDEESPARQIGNAPGNRILKGSRVGFFGTVPKRELENLSSTEEYRQSLAKWQTTQEFVERMQGLL
jgi:hypothetical protein